MITQPQVRAPQRCSSKGKSERSSQKYYRHKKIWRQDTKILKKKNQWSTQATTQGKNTTYDPTTKTQGFTPYTYDQDATPD